MVKLLGSLGADLSARNDKGDTPLHQALWNVNVDMVKLLVSLGADLSVRNNKDDSPLSQAAFYVQFTMVKVLCSLGANLSAGNVEGDTPLHQAVCADLSARNDKGDTPLHQAVCNMVKLLVSLDADLSARIVKGDTPLHQAVCKGRADMVKLLVSLGADLSARNDKGGSPLHQATNQEEQNNVELLVSLGANLSARNNEGDTPLHQAVGNGQLTMVKALTSQGADITAMNNEEKKDTIEKTSEQLTVTSKKETAGNDSRSLPIARKSIEKDKDIQLPWLVDANEFKCMLSQGEFLSYDKSFESRNGIDIEKEKMLPLKEGERGHEILAKILRGKPNVYEQYEHKINQQTMHTHSYHSQAELINKSPSASSILVAVQGKMSTEVQTHQVLTKCSELMTEDVGTKVLNKGMPVVPSEIKSLDLQTMQLQTNILQEVRDRKYKIKIAPSDLIDFGAILKHWVDSVLTYTEDTEDIMPMIMFAATHRDLCMVNTVKLKEGFIKDLNLMFSKHEKKPHIYLDTVFFINGIDENDVEIQRMTDQVVIFAMKQSSWGQRRPMQWVPLELQISK
ncbi:unnamed protein product [Mytilus edulis]|uniref:Uncharacterized protein n=1 Tax=Mytilus edulis TaxID=6550 RepID=A0A8S3UWH3_MYTED|nr:unnamed protein product [Mytilus edulis]